MYVRPGFAPSNHEFRRLTVACAEAALRSDGAFAAAGDAARAAVAMRGQQRVGEQEVDLHGLSATEARVAVLSVLSSIQVRISHDLVSSFTSARPWVCDCCNLSTCKA